MNLIKLLKRERNGGNVQRPERIKQVEEINMHAHDLMNSARRRDMWYVNNLTDLQSDVVVTEEQIREIEEFWQPYEFAYKNDVNIQLAFYKQSGVFDPSYIGFGLQRYSLNRFWNNETFSTFRNKNFSKLLFPFVKTPTDFIANNYGIYWDGEKIF